MTSFPANHTCAVLPDALMNRTSSPDLISTVCGLFSSLVTVTLASAQAPSTPSANVTMTTPTTTLTLCLIVASSWLMATGSAHPARRPEPHGQGAAVVRERGDRVEPGPGEADLRVEDLHLDTAPGGESLLDDAEFLIGLLEALPARFDALLGRPEHESGLVDLLGDLLPDEALGLDGLLQLRLGRLEGVLSREAVEEWQGHHHAHRVPLGAVGARADTLGLGLPRAVLRQGPVVHVANGHLREVVPVGRPYIRLGGLPLLGGRLEIRVTLARLPDPFADRQRRRGDLEAVGQRDRRR